MIKNDLIEQSPESQIISLKKTILSDAYEILDCVGKVYILKKYKIYFFYKFRIEIRLFAILKTVKIFHV